MYYPILPSIFSMAMRSLRLSDSYSLWMTWIVSLFYLISGRFFTPIVYNNFHFLTPSLLSLDFYIWEAKHISCMIEKKIISLASRFWNFTMMCLKSVGFRIHFVGAFNVKMHILQLWTSLISSSLPFLISLSRSTLYGKLRTAQLAQW